MRPEDLWQWQRRRPFRPFRVRLNSGRTFDIRHPEMVDVGRSVLHVFTYRDGEPDELIDQLHDVALLLIETIEPLPPAAAPAS